MEQLSSLARQLKPAWQADLTGAESPPESPYFVALRISWLPPAAAPGGSGSWKSDPRGRVRGVNPGHGDRAGPVAPAAQPSRRRLESVRGGMAGTAGHPTPSLGHRRWRLRAVVGAGTAGWI